MHACVQFTQYIEQAEALKRQTRPAQQPSPSHGASVGDARALKARAQGESLQGEQELAARAVAGNRVTAWKPGMHGSLPKLLRMPCMIDNDIKGIQAN